MKMHRFDNGIPLRVARTPEGYLRGRAALTRTGIFFYRGQDGTIIRELRHPDDVFSASSVASLNGIPITNLHPATETGLVDSSNAQALSIGFTGSDAGPDGQFLCNDVTITAKAGVDAVDGGREELSLGYIFELDETPGVYDGMEYDCRQRNIIYNHLAVVEKGRAGASVRLNKDSAMECPEECPESCKGDACGGKRKKSAGDCAGSGNNRRDTMLKINIDGIDYEVPPQIARHIEKLTADLSAKQKAFDTVAGERDGLKDLLQQANSKLTPESIAELVGKRVLLERMAVDFLDDSLKSGVSKMSDIDIMKNVIKSRFPDAAFDGQSEERIAGRYETVIAMKGAAAQQKTAVDGANQPKVDSRKAMMDRMVSAHRGGK